MGDDRSGFERLEGHKYDSHQMVSCEIEANRRSGLSYDLPAKRYDLWSVALHWLIMCGVIAEATTGFLFFKLKSGTPTYEEYYYWHRSVGELIFVLVGISLAWRHVRPPVTVFPDVSWRQTAAKIVQGVLVALLILVPLLKIWRDAYGLGWVFFSMNIRPPLPANDFMGALLSDLHLYLAVALLVLSAVHAGAALWHEFVDRDRLLKRMGI